jgi:hypothetical protein
MKTIQHLGRGVEVDDSTDLTEDNRIAKVASPTLPTSYLIVIRRANGDNQVLLPELDYHIDGNEDLELRTPMFLFDTLRVLDLATGQVSWTYSANAVSLPLDPMPPAVGG